MVTVSHQLHQLSCAGEMSKRKRKTGIVMDTVKQGLARFEPEQEHPGDPAPSRRPAKRRLLVVGDRAMVDPLRSAIEESPGLVAGNPDATSRVLHTNGAGVLVVDVLDRSEEGGEPDADASDPSAVWPGFSLEAAEVLGDLLKAVVETTRSASLRKSGSVSKLIRHIPARK
jgi:hypothetical protein